MPRPKPSGLTCRICFRRWSSARRLKRHYELDHTPLRRCPTCGKRLRDDEYHRC